MVFDFCFTYHKLENRNSYTFIAALYNGKKQTVFEAGANDAILTYPAGDMMEETRGKQVVYDFINELLESKDRLNDMLGE